jgi:hypothetical protein
MQFWIGLLIGAMLGASVGLLILAWLYASRRAEDAEKRGGGRTSTPASSEWRPYDDSVPEASPPFVITATDAEALRAAADAMEATGASADEVSRLRNLASLARDPEQPRPAPRRS